MKTLIVSIMVLIVFSIFYASPAQAVDYPSSTTTALTVDLDFNGKKISNLGDVISKSPWRDVRAYGAKGDGSTNDATAIQSAIDDAGNAGGGVVFIPSGTYMTGSQLTVPSKVTVCGTGSGSVVRRATSLDAVNGLFYLNGSSGDVTDVTIRDLCIDINGTSGLSITSNGFCVEMRASGTNRIRRSRVENCYLKDGWIGGVSAVNAVNCNVANNFFVGCGNHTNTGSTPLLFESSTECHAEGNTFVDCCTVAGKENISYVIDVSTGSSRCIVSNNIIYNSSSTGQGFGIGIRGTSPYITYGCVVSGNIIDGIDRPPIFVQGTSLEISTTEVTDTTVVNNVIRNASRDPVNTHPCIKEDSTRCVLSGNVTQSSTANVGIESVGNDTTLIGNNCSAITNTTNGTGIYVAGNRKTIVGNVCNRNGLTGINAENLHHSVIAMNTMLDNGGTSAGDGLKFSSDSGGVTYTMAVMNNIGDTRSGSSRTQRLGFNNSLNTAPATGSQGFLNMSENNVISDFSSWPNAAGVANWLNLVGTTPAADTTGSFTLSATASTTVSNTAVRAASRIFIFPTNAAASLLMQGAKSLYVSAKTANTSFTVSTQNGAAAAGTETFDYLIVP